ncbi:DUF3785 family protein [Anaerotalea alkaliphila]|uniref:DUF3785 domain-containing protein n=1 Tax=Anaerotalea alkaliphila TaxID=2662126 RepID=A0A7X5KL80_9FIRM|nr:DUF3785 family protein [Anaerotalea alkaliphila]NDL66556.1 DUF3785 domain-containing protein [Anaerotalea alkaliphila]
MLIKAEGKEYVLEEAGCYAFEIGEGLEVEGLDFERVSGFMEEGGVLEFEPAYYDSWCENCEHGKGGKAKSYRFLAFDFYIFTKEGRIVASSLDKDYQEHGVLAMEKKGMVDGSLLVEVVLCPNCGEYSIEVLPCDF